MAASNPYSAIDAIVAAAFATHPAVTAILPQAGMIQVWDREIDIRGDLAEAEDAGPRLWIMPDEDGGDDWQAANAATNVGLVYVIGYGTSSMKLSEVRDLQWAIT